MFKNRAFQVKVVKTDEEDNVTYPVTEDVYAARIAQAKDATIEILKHGAVMVAGYVALDTARKVAIERAKK